MPPECKEFAQENISSAEVHMQGKRSKLENSIKIEQKMIKCLLKS